MIDDDYGDFSKESNQKILEATKEFVAARAKYMKLLGLSDMDRAPDQANKRFVANLLGYNRVNEKKHGFSAFSSSSKRMDYLAIKNVMLSKEMKATWNDLPKDRAAEYGIWAHLAVAVWDNGELKFICYGGNEELGRELYGRVCVEQMEGKKTVIEICLDRLVNKFGLKIYCCPGKEAETEGLVKVYLKKVWNKQVITLEKT